MEDLSLRSTAAWSSQAALELKDTSVLHRLRKAPPLLERVLAHLLSQRLRAEPAAGPEFRINDATVLSIPGSQGTDWRLHAVYDPAHCRLLRVEITDSQGGERLDRDRPQAGDIVCGDRGLAHARGIHAVSQAGAYVLLRMHWQNIRLHNAEEQPLDLEPILKRARAGETGTVAYVPLAGKAPVPVRILIRPLPTEAANRSRQRLRRNAAKKGRTPNATALRLAGYFCVLTTLPETLASDEVVLELYRIRWQIELFFKSIKQQLKVKSFVGTSQNALLSQLWIALIAYLLLSYLKFKSKFKWSIYILCCILPANLFARRNLWDWLDSPYHESSKISLDILQQEFNFS